MLRGCAICAYNLLARIGHELTLTGDRQWFAQIWDARQTLYDLRYD